MASRAEQRAKVRVVIPILFQDSNMVVVDKPPGLSVHNPEGGDHLLTVLGQQLELEKPLLPVHRLDKETSGVQVLALNGSTAKRLAAEFENRTVKKTYVGILRGTLPAPAGVWNKPLTDKAEGRRQPQGDPKGRIACETHFKSLRASKYFTQAEFDLITGRQHQIRKHAALDNHALVGDPRYGDPKYNARMADLYKTTRMLLHCHSLTIAGQTVVSPIPSEFDLFFSSVN